MPYYSFPKGHECHDRSAREARRSCLHCTGCTVEEAKVWARSGNWSSGSTRQRREPGVEAEVRGPGPGYRPKPLVISEPWELQGLALGSDRDAAESCEHQIAALLFVSYGLALLLLYVLSASSASDRYPWELEQEEAFSPGLGPSTLTRMMATVSQPCDVNQSDRHLAEAAGCLSEAAKRNREKGIGSPVSS